MARRAFLAVLLLGALAGCAHPPAPPEPAAPREPGKPATAPGTCPDPVTAAALACRINADEAVLRDPASAPAALADAGRSAQDAYRTLGDHPDWDAPVRAALQPGLREHAARAVAAERELVSLAGDPKPTLPAWRVVEPPPADTLRTLYRDAQKRFGVSWTVLAAINLVETRMGRVVGLSSAGAQGPMQFMPATWARYGLGGNVWDTRDAINGAANFLAANGATSPAKLDTAIKRYNNDVRYVRAVRDYAAMLDADPRVLVGLHSWPVKYRTTAGDIALPVGYQEPKPVPVADWLKAHPN